MIRSVNDGLIRVQRIHKDVITNYSKTQSLLRAVVLQLLFRDSYRK